MIIIIKMSQYNFKVFLFYFLLYFSRVKKTGLNPAESRETAEQSGNQFPAANCQFGTADDQYSPEDTQYLEEYQYT